MRIFVLTQEDAFYIPSLLDHLFEKRPDVIGVGVVPGELRRGHLRRYFQLMGPRDFTLQVVNLAGHRACEVLNRVVPFGRSFSVTDAARRHRVPLERVPKVNAPEFVQSLRDRQVELLVSVACPQVCKRELLSVAARGAINIHGALLPD